ncbi:MAG: ubiquitin-like small modifier protein 1 [bacterium]
MSNTILIPTALRQFTDGQGELTVDATTVGQALDQLVSQFPTLQQHLFNDDKAVRSFVNLYVNDENIRHKSGLDTPLASGDTVMIVPSIAGGL